MIEINTLQDENPDIVDEAISQKFIGLKTQETRKSNGSNRSIPEFESWHESDSPVHSRWPCQRKPWCVHITDAESDHRWWDHTELNLASCPERLSDTSGRTSLIGIAAQAVEASEWRGQERKNHATALFHREIHANKTACFSHGRSIAFTSTTRHAIEIKISGSRGGS